MRTKIEERPEMMIVGMVATGSNIKEIEINDLWEEFAQKKEVIKYQIPGKNYEIHLDDLSADRHYCVAGVEVERLEDLPLEVFVKLIPAGKYAIFTHEFKEGGFETAYRLMNEWMILNQYTQAFPLEIQRFDERFLGMENPRSMMEFWIPIQKART